MLGYVGFSALAVQEERSFAEPGRKIGTELVTIIDDGADTAGLPMSFDYEGVRQGARQLLEAGVCRSVVYDSQTAARAGRASTGHGLPAPNPWGPFPLNAVMSAGHDAARRADRRPGPRPAGHALPLHQRRPPEARDDHGHDSRRHVPRRGRQDRRAGPEPALHAVLPRRARRRVRASAAPARPSGASSAPRSCRPSASTPGPSPASPSSSGHRSRPDRYRSARWRQAIDRWKHPERGLGWPAGSRNASADPAVVAAALDRRGPAGHRWVDRDPRARMRVRDRRDGAALGGPRRGAGLLHGAVRGVSGQPVRR